MSKRTIFEEIAGGGGGSVAEYFAAKQWQLRTDRADCVEAEETAPETAGNPIQSGAYAALAGGKSGRRAVERGARIHVTGKKLRKST